MAGNPEKPLATLPLQIGTAAVWGAARGALTLFPGLAAIVLGIVLGFVYDWPGEGAMIPVVLGGLLVAYAVVYIRFARKARASDLLLLEEGIRVDGGTRHGCKIAWKELSSPYAEVAQGTAKRLVLRRLPWAAFSAVGGGSGGDPEADVTVWRLWVWREGQKELLAETDRAIEAESMKAAVASIEAVALGKHYAEEAPSIETEFASCKECGAPLVPEDAETVVCAFCRATVPLDQDVRRQAVAAMAMEKGRGRTTKMIAKLLDQPRAASANAWLVLFSVPMFCAWPIGWALVGARVFAGDLRWIDVAYFWLPLMGVLAGFFFARGRLADRGALQLLTLAFGALAPKKKGEPARCRRCQGPLPDLGIGGVVQCRYCRADNITGIDLRPLVDKTRGEQESFDAALAVRRREKLRWALLTLLATVALAGWIGATLTYAKTVS